MPWLRQIYTFRDSPRYWMICMIFTEFSRRSSVYVRYRLVTENTGTHCTHFHHWNYFMYTHYWYHSFSIKKAGNTSDRRNRHALGALSSPTQPPPVVISSWYQYLFLLMIRISIYDRYSRKHLGMNNKGNEIAMRAGYVLDDNLVFDRGAPCLLHSIMGRFRRNVHLILKHEQ